MSWVRKSAQLFQGTSLSGAFFFLSFKTRTLSRKENLPWPGVLGPLRSSGILHSWLSWADVNPRATEPAAHLPRESRRGFPPGLPFLREQKPKSSEWGASGQLILYNKVLFTLFFDPSQNTFKVFTFLLFLMVLLLDPNEHLCYRIATWSTCSAELWL